MRVAALLAVAWLGCAHAKGSGSVNLGKPTDVKSLLALREPNRRELLSLLQLQPGDVREEVSYEKLSGVGRANNAALHPGHFYLRGDRIELVYVGNAAFLSGLKPAAIQKELGGDGTRLRSRVGKTSNQYVYPEKGFAYSETDGALDFVEIFAPMSLEQYRQRIYEDVGPFTK